MRSIKFLVLTLIFASSITMSAENKVKKGVDRANLDETITPGEDFYQYACGGWMKNNPLQAQYSRFGTFDELAETNRAQIKELIQNLGTDNKKGSVAQKVSDLYLMGMDSVRLNAEGIAPLKADLAKIASLKKGSITETLAWLHYGLAGAFFGVGPEADMLNSDVTILYLGPSGLGLGDRDYYLENDKNIVTIRNAYSNYVATLFKLIGYKEKDSKKAAATILKIETEIAKSLMTREESRDISKQYNIKKIDEIKSEYSAINWESYFSYMGWQNVDKLCVTQPVALKKVNELLVSLTEKELRDYITYKYVRSASSYLSDDFVVANFEMFSKTLSGKTEMQPRWKRALDVPNSYLGEAVGELYVNKYFPGDSKEKMLKLVNNLKIALAEHIAGLDWMSDKTKVNALVKLNSFRVKIGYPDKWRDYTDLSIDPSLSYWENIKNASIFETKRANAEYGKPVDREAWGMTPQTVNAYYNPTTNEICFPAGILQAPYFDPNSDDACNYGAIGVVIGHEMTHGFDDQGRNFDQSGNMTDWWTAEDAKKFTEKTDVLVEQFNKIIVAGDQHANGRFTLGENIADQGGLRVAYTAFKKTEQGKSNEKIDGFTPDQRFYISYADVWAGNITEQEILRRTKTDPHSLGRWRVNASLKNIDTFFKAFGIKEGDKMYVKPEDRVVIW